MEALTILSTVFEPNLVMCIPFLIMVGYIIKHYTYVENRFIPYIESSLGVIIGIAYGLSKNEASFVWNVTMYGAQGFIIGSLAMTFYEYFHKLINHNCKPQEVDMEKKKFHPMDHTWFVYGLAIVESVIACGLIELVFHGKDEMLTWFTQYAHLTVIPCVAIDMMMMVSREKPLITWQYFVLEALIVLADVLFTWASITTTNGMCWAMLTLTAITVAGAVIWYCKFYKPAVAKRCEEVIGIMNDDLAELGMPGQYKGIAINYFFKKGE